VFPAQLGSGTYCLENTVNENEYTKVERVNPNAGDPVFYETKRNNKRLTTTPITIKVVCDSDCEAIGCYHYGSETPKGWDCEEIRQKLADSELGRGDLSSAVNGVKTFTFNSLPVGEGNQEQNLMVWIGKTSHGRWECYAKKNAPPTQLAVDLGTNTLGIRSPDWHDRESFLGQLLPKSFDPWRNLIGLEPLVVASDLSENFDGTIDVVGTSQSPISILPFVPLAGTYMIPRIKFRSPKTIRRAVMTVMRQNQLIPQWPVGNYMVEANLLGEINGERLWEACNVPSAVSDELGADPSDNKIIVWSQAMATKWAMDKKPVWCQYAIG
jgi:hypothetical protein